MEKPLSASLSTQPPRFESRADWSTWVLYFRQPKSSSNSPTTGGFSLSMFSGALSPGTQGVCEDRMYQDRLLWPGCGRSPTQLTDEERAIWDEGVLYLTWGS